MLLGPKLFLLAYHCYLVRFGAYDTLFHLKLLFGEMQKGI
jgi:hypothetical protein